MENRQRLGLSCCFSILSHCLCLNVSVPSARRSRTTERSESVSEEAEYIRYHISSLRSYPFCTCFMWQLCCAFLRCYIVSQYTLR